MDVVSFVILIVLALGVIVAVMVRGDGGNLTAFISPGERGWDGEYPPGVWVNATPRLSVAGAYYRKAAVVVFASLIDKAEQDQTPYGVRLELDPTNRHDPNAIKVIGYVGSVSNHVGFVDRKTAREAHEDLISQGHPIAARLVSVYIGEKDDVNIHYNVLGPKGHGYVARQNQRSKATTSDE